jgi:DNA-binding NarL/FixJ family response regulator
MMTNFQEKSINSERLSSVNYFSAVTQFCIENKKFLVILLDESAEKSKKVQSDIEKKCSLLELGYFELSGHRYMIAIDQDSAQAEELDLINLLTGRELQIASLVAIGWSNKQVASQLHISEWTVSAHLRRIFIKIHVDSRAAMVYKCAPLINQLHHFQQLELKALVNHSE